MLQYSCLEYRCFMSMILGFQDHRFFCPVSDRWRREQMNKDSDLEDLQDLKPQLVSNARFRLPFRY